MVIAAKENPLQELLEHGPVTLQSPLTREEFAALAARFPELQMEREANGKTNIKLPVKKGSRKRETTLKVKAFLAKMLCPALNYRWTNSG